ncbi:MAG: hypothetical protein JWQ99_2219 [Blastococcus sp.]|nr:hypothetical protein [Blastococcus sp.]
MARRLLTGAVIALVFGALSLVPGVATARVSSTPAPTPQLGTSGTDGTVEQVHQIIQCGGTMYAVGRFTQVKNAGSNTLIARSNAFAFSATAPYQVTAWNPNVNGEVETAACGTDGSILLGGAFSRAGGAAATNLAKVNATTGAALPFAFHPAGRVFHIEVVKGHLLVGGSIAGLLRSVSPVTGASDGYGMPAISGTYSYGGMRGPATRIHNMNVSPDGAAVLLTGVFNSVGGQRHEQIFRLNVAAGPGAAVVSAWRPTELEEHCETVQPFYARDATWSPDGKKIYTATTGYKPYAGSTSGPRTGPCDAVIAYPSTEAPITGHLWINYTGCDSLYSVAADATTVYAGGHQRFASNPLGCDRKGPGGIDQPGLGEFDPVTGNHQPGPSRGRGIGATDLLRTAAGLWIASDNLQNTSTCAGQSNRVGICFLPN